MKLESISPLYRCVKVVNITLSGPHAFHVVLTLPTMAPVMFGKPTILMATVVI